MHSAGYISGSVLKWLHGIWSRLSVIIFSVLSVLLAGSVHLVLWKSHTDIGEKNCIHFVADSLQTESKPLL